jgi:hypothetical protein
MGPVHRWILYHMIPQGRAIHLGLTGPSSTCSTVPHCITVLWSRLAAVAFHVLVCLVWAIGRRVTDNQATTRVADLSCWPLGMSRFAPLADEWHFSPMSPIYNETLISETASLPLHCPRSIPDACSLCIERKYFSCSSSPAFHSGACWRRTIPRRSRPTRAR